MKGSILVALAALACATAGGTTPHAAVPATTFTFVGGGDIALVGGGATRSTFAGIARFLHGDLVMANLEGTLATSGSPHCAPYGVDGCFTFRASPASAATLRAAGFDVLNVANNHALDYGAVAQRETLAALRTAHIAYDGLPGQITVVQAGPVRVAVVGFAPYPWAQSLLDVPAAQALVRRARSHGAVVVVYMHAGAEGPDADHVTGRPETFLGEQRGNPRAFAHAMIAAGASLVFASGPHVLRGMEWFQGHLIAYSLGNLAGNHTLSTGESLSRSALLTVRLGADGRFVGGRLVPLRLDSAGTPAYDPARGAVALVGRLSREDFGAGAVRLRATGTIAALPKLSKG